MIRVLLLVVIICAAFWLLRKFLSTPAEKISLLLKQLGAALIIGLLIFFAASGRLNWLFALLGIFMTFLIRLLPYFIRYVPQLHKMWQIFGDNKPTSAESNTEQPFLSSMTKKEAYDILGLTVSASKDDIIKAHRKLMQKVHPDHGGSNYLAVKINQAKKILLEK